MMRQMLVYLHYALATFCFAASVGCLALWWRSMTERLFAQVHGSTVEFTIEGRNGYLVTYKLPTGKIGAPFVPNGPWWSEPDDDLWSESLRRNVDRMGRFAAYKYGVIFPIWYPTLIFALAGVGVLRFRRQFSIRSALIATTVVAALIGMAVIL